PPGQWPDGNFTACHILYTSTRREPSGAGWRTDYPWGERHLLMRLSELTKTRISRSAPNIPHSWLVRLTDDALFGCPYLMASDVGTIGLTDMEAARLRLYLEQGGFMWVDDVWDSIRLDPVPDVEREQALGPKHASGLGVAKHLVGKEHHPELARDGVE